MTYQLVIFDFDGTLADSADWTQGILNGVAQRYGFRAIGDAEIAMLRGCDNRAIVRYLGVPPWKLPLIARHVRRLAAQDAGRIRLFEGIGDLLRRLCDKGITLAMVSSNAEDTIRRILGPENAARITYYECGASLFGKGAKFRKVLRRSGIPREAAICIGDEARDIEAAARERIASGAVTWGYATAELLAAHSPTHIFASPGEIIERLGA